MTILRFAAATAPSVLAAGGMGKFQELRLDRAKRQGLRCMRVRFTEGAACFSIVGLSDMYEVLIDQDARLWPPTCSCADNAWRPELLCKHITLVLHRMGAVDEQLSDCCWEPSQHEMYEMMFNAPDVVDELSHGDGGPFGHSAHAVSSEFR